ncbi:MAG TPA: hypothetical protein VF702_00955 [Allosphingosinicella sp.]|jgi:hypothetical protein
MIASSRFTTWLRRAADAADLTFCKMARIQFDAPWRVHRPGRC